MRKQALNFLYYYFLVAARNFVSIGDDELADEHAEHERPRRRSFESYAQDDLIIASDVTSLLANSQNKSKHPRGGRKKNEDRNDQKLFWTRGYALWDSDRFRRRLRITRPAFELLLRELGPLIEKTPTNAVPNPIEGNLK